MSTDPRLGRLLSEHWPAYTYPILFSLIALSLAVGGIYVGLNGDMPGYFVSVVTIALLALYLSRALRRRLFVHEHGFHLRFAGTDRVMLWRDITSASATYSFHPHPDTIVDVTLKSGVGPRFVLRMTWSNHKALRAALWPLLEAQATRT